MYIIIGIAILILASAIFYPKVKYNIAIKKENDLLFQKNFELIQDQENLENSISELNFKVKPLNEYVK